MFFVVDQLGCATWPNYRLPRATTCLAKIMVSIGQIGQGSNPRPTAQQPSTLPIILCNGSYPYMGSFLFKFYKGCKWEERLGSQPRPPVICSLYNLRHKGLGTWDFSSAPDRTSPPWPQHTRTIMSMGGGVGLALALVTCRYKGPWLSANWRDFVWGLAPCHMASNVTTKNVWGDAAVRAGHWPDPQPYVRQMSTIQRLRGWEHRRWVVSPAPWPHGPCGQIIPNKVYWQI